MQDVEEMMSKTTPGTPEAEAAPGEATASDEVTARLAELEQLLAAEQAKADEYKENWQRSHADFTNFRRRNESERSDLIAYGNTTLLTKLLPVVDDFDLALANLPPEAKDSSWIEGITLIQRKLQRLLESEGVAPIEALGQPFDPNLHEAVVMDDGAREPYSVVAELRKGYRIRDRVLRPTVVRVGDAAPPA
jgi:molecular chaperone GrpE